MSDPRAAWLRCFDATDVAVSHIEGLTHALDILREHHPDLSDSRPQTGAIISTVTALTDAVADLIAARAAERAAIRGQWHAAEGQA